MSIREFRPKNYQQAITFLRERRDKRAVSRVLSRAGYEIRDQVYARTDNPTEIDTGTPVVCFRLYATDIAVFYPDGRIEVNGWASNLTDNRLRDMRLPTLLGSSNVSHQLGTKARLLLDHDRMWGGCGDFVDKYPLGVPGRQVVLRRTTDCTNGFGSYPFELAVHPNSYVLVDAVKVPDMDSKRRFTRSKKALLKVLRNYVRMFEALHGPEASGSGSPWQNVSLDIEIGLTNGRSVRDWEESLEEWLNDKYTHPESVHVLLDNVEMLTFWDAAEDCHFTEYRVPAHRTKEFLDGIRL